MSTSPPDERLSLPEFLQGAGAALVFIGAYVPWVVTTALITSVPVRGADTEYGRILALIPLAAAGLLAWRWYMGGSRSVHLAVAACGVVIVALGLIYATGVSRNLARTQQSLARSGLTLPGTVSVRFDVGFYLSLIGGAAMAAGGAMGYRR